MVAYETLPWKGRHERGTASRTKIQRHKGPYQAAIVPEIARRTPALAADVLAEADDAATEIARFDAAMGGEIAPFGAVLLRSESAASSQIENLTASARAIAEAEIGDTRRRNAALIVANTRAMEAAVALADHLDADAILAMHRALCEAAEPAIAGRNVTVPISAGLLTDTAAYFDALGAYRAGDPTAMVRQLSEASFAAIANGRQLAAELRTIRSDWNTRIPARRDSATWRVADLLMRHPVVNAQLLTRELGVAANNVYRYIDPLVQADVLTEFTDQRRNRAWRSTEVLVALDAFAVRAGKRRLPT
jgi:hypothetical protein